MSISCPHCGSDIDTDEEIQNEVITEMDGVIAIPIEVVTSLRQQINMLNQMVIDGTSHNDRTEALTASAIYMLDIMEE